MIMTLTKEDVQKEVDRIIDEKLENYFRMSRPGFVIESGGMSGGHGLSEYCLTTDTIQGIHFYKQGNCKLVSNKSLELQSGETAGEDEIAVSIRAVGGDVEIEAPSGDVIIKGVNIQLHADEVLHMEGNNMINIYTPNLEFYGDKFNVVAISNLFLLGGGTSVFHANIDCEISSGVDLAAGGWLDKLINLQDNLKKLKVFL